MKKYDKEIAQAQLDNEKAVLKQLEANYKDALEEINSKIAELMGRADADMQHVVYQVEYQKALKAQTEAILKTLQNNEFETVSAYLTNCYDEGFISTLYAIQQQGVPLVFPINQEEVAAAIQLQTNLSTSLYEAFDMKDLQKKIAGEISRGFSTGALYSEITRNVAAYAGISKNKAMRIVRTEGHRITETAASNAQKRAKDRGADIVKIWDSTLDGKTRPSHMRVDGEIREIGKKFSNGLEFPGDPSGKAAEVINCRCRSRSDARWALEADETKMLGDVSEMSEERKKEIAKKLGVPVDTLDQYSNQIVPVKAKDYADFKRQYDQLWRYEGSALQKEAEERIASYGKSRSANENADVLQKETFVSRFKPAQTMQEAEEYAQQFVSTYKSKYTGNVVFKGLDVEHANAVNKVLTDVYDRFDIDRLGNIETMNFRESKWKNAVENGVAGAYQWGGSGGNLFINQKIFGNAKSEAAFFKKAEGLLKTVLNGVDDLLARPDLKAKQRRYIEALKKSGVQCAAQKFDNFAEATMIHESGHMLEDKLFFKLFKEEGFDVSASMDVFANGVSGYAVSSTHEYIAESFTYYWYGKTEALDPDLVRLFKKAEKTEKALETVAKSDIIRNNISYATIIPDEKFTQYALNPLKSPDKAKVFESALGYNQSNYNDLKQNILDHIDESKFVEKGDTGYGMRYEYIMELTGANGQKANVLTAWIADGEDKRMTSVYVTNRGVTE